MVEEGERVIKEVDDRYRKAGLYWDHQEFGGHYYRPMSAWSILHSYLGLGIRDGHYSFNPKLLQTEYTLFFSHGKGTAHYSRSEKGISISVNSGNMGIKSLEISDPWFSKQKPEVSINGSVLSATVKSKNGFSSIVLPERIALKEDDRLEIIF